MPPPHTTDPTDSLESQIGDQERKVYALKIAADSANREHAAANDELVRLKNVLKNHGKPPEIEKGPDYYNFNGGYRKSRKRKFRKNYRRRYTR